MSFPISMDAKKPIKTTYWGRKNDAFINWAYKHVRISKDYYNNFFDITTINTNSNIPKCDILTYSFPCQDISIQGKGKGLAKDLSTRSSLLWKLMDLLAYYKKNDIFPSILLMENVSAIENKRHLEHYLQWIKFLKKYGYESKRLMLNSIDFQSIQSRKRAFLVSIHKDSSLLKLKILDKFSKDLFKPKQTNKNIGSILEKYDNDHEWYKKTNFTYLLDKHDKVGDFVLTKNGIKKTKLKNYSQFNSEATIYSIDGKSPTITATGANSRIKCYDHNEKQLLALCPLACFQLMGFTKTQFKAIYKEVHPYISYHKLLHVIGNGIVKEVLKYILEILLNEIG